jgi:hypothetical protein
MGLKSAETRPATPLLANMAKDYYLHPLSHSHSKEFRLWFNLPDMLDLISKPVFVNV